MTGPVNKSFVCHHCRKEYKYESWFVKHVQQHSLNTEKTRAENTLHQERARKEVVVAVLLTRLQELVAKGEVKDRELQIRAEVCTRVFKHYRATTNPMIMD